MTIKTRFIYYVLVTSTLLSFDRVNNFDVKKNEVIIKFEESFAPKLGQETAISREQFSDLFPFVKDLILINFSPLFFNTQNFKNIEYKHNLHHYYILKFGTNVDFNFLKNEFELNPNIDLVEPNYIKKTSLTPNDTYYDSQWAHNNVGQQGWVPNSDTDTNLAWDLTTGNTSVVIAILDTGVNEHPELQGRLVDGYDYVYQDNDPNDVQGHGTSCAGIAAAKGNNNSGIAGVCWDCSIMPVKVLGDDGYGEDSIIAAAIQQIAADGVDIISMSLGGGGFNTYLENAISYAVDLGTVVFAASGNDDSNVISYPAAYDDCISVGAMSPCNERKSSSSCDGENYWGSNYGPTLDFVAPGVKINTITSSGGYTSSFNGTSSACPHAAGIAGLILSVAPNMNPEQVKMVMQMNADDISELGYDNQTGYGKVNAYQSVLNLLNAPEVFVDIQSLNIELNQGALATEDFVLVNIGDADLSVSVDQDSYQSVDSNSGFLPYEWIDISSDSQILNMSHNDYFSNDPVLLNFNFPFYENYYSSLNINSNGWLGFSEDNTGWENLSLPDSQAPLNAIFPFWDDLNPANDSNSSGNGIIRFSNFADKTVVWFDSVDHWPTNFEGSNYDFQTVLYSSGDIRFNYRTMLGESNSATIGIQNFDASLATQLSFNSDFVTNQFSALMYKFPNWLSLDMSNQILSPGNSEVISLTFDTSNLLEGTYNYQMILETNDFQQPQVIIPIFLTVNGDACSDWTQGDINQDVIFNVLDVILAVNFILSDEVISDCEFFSTDLNEDGVLNILDILRIVNLALD